MLGHRHDALLLSLRRTSHPVSGDELAVQLQVSARSVRQYVKDINREAAREVIEASHRGYQLNHEAYEKFLAERQHRPPAGATPHERIFAIVSALLRQSDGTDVDSLAESLHVSTSTIEADLVRVREVLAEFGLKLRRDWRVLRIEGPESQRRRVVRQIIVDSARGDYPAFMGQAFARFEEEDVRLLRLAVTEALRSHDLMVNEYALNDLVLHLMIAIDRFRSGHRVRSAEAASDLHESDLAAAVAQLAAFLERTMGVVLTPAERRYVEQLLEVKTVRYEGRALSDPALVEGEYVELVRDIVAGLSQNYVIDVDDAFVLNLSLHVRGLITRAEAGRTAHNPVASSFKAEHPLVHELAVYVAHQLELRRDIEVGPDEIAFLAFHIGSQLLRGQPPTERVTITCVIPRFHQMPALMHEHLSRALPPEAEISEVVTALDADWSAVTSDLIVSSVPLPGSDLPPTVIVSPLLTHSDLEQVGDAVRRLRERRARLRLRTNLVELLDPLFFHCVSSARSRDEALILMTERLVAEGAVHKDYLADVMEREALSSTAFGPLAVPHSLHLDAHQTTISVMVCEEPIPWGESRVRLVAMFVLAPNGRAVFRKVLDELIKVLSEPAHVDRLAGVRSYEELVDAIFAILDR